MSDENSQNRVGLLTGLDEILDPAHTAIVVIDMQNDFCAENGYIHNAQDVDMSANKPLAARIGKLVSGKNSVFLKSNSLSCIQFHNFNGYLITRPIKLL